jgi:hypothetical protein
MVQKFANAARAYLASTVSDSATTVTIDGGGSLFPAITSPEFSRAVLQDANGIEVVLITAHTAGSDTFTVTRGQEGTTARSFATGSVFGIRMTSADGDTFVAKQDALVSGTNIKTVNGDSLLGSGNLAVSGGLEYSVKTANYTAVDKQGVLADTSGGAFTVTLPATPAAGAQVVIADAGASWGTNNLTVARNGSTIGGLAEDLVCDITGASVQFVYDGTTWEVYAQIGGNGGTGGGGSVAGSDTQIQFNNSGAFGASSALTFSGTQLSVGNGTEGTVYFNGSSFGLIKSLSDLYYDGNTQIFRTAAGAESMRMVSSGALVLKGGNATPGGTGITFPATQSASSNANTLDDYEEGTWTPAISGTTSASGQTYSDQTGTYTKIGNTCTITGRIALSNKGTITGQPIITGMPFNRAGGDQGRVPFFIYFENTTVSTNYVSGLFDETARMILFKSTATATSSTLFASGDTDLANNTIFNFALTYRTS